MRLPHCELVYLLVLNNHGKCAQVFEYFDLILSSKPLLKISGSRCQTQGVGLHKALSVGRSVCRSLFSSQQQVCRSLFSSPQQVWLCLPLSADLPLPSLALLIALSAVTCTGPAELSWLTSC